MVGVVTHLPALAERMPARITVHKSQSGSTVTIG
jgi:DNA repair exonuclease SbcCD ATPase subunit